MSGNEEESNAVPGMADNGASSSAAGAPASSSSSRRRYYCHRCGEEVVPETTAVELECPQCHDSFLEEINVGEGEEEQEAGSGGGVGGIVMSQEMLRLFLPLILGMQTRPAGAEEVDALDFIHELETAFLRRQLQDLMIRQLVGDENSNEGSSNGGSTVFMPMGLELLLQHLAENDPSRSGPPPAKKDVVEALPRVAVEGGGTNCSICLEELAVGEMSREMPCKHVFHDKCIVPWLEIHGSCPVCRFLLPTDDQAPPADAVVEDRHSSSNVGASSSGGRRRSWNWWWHGLFHRSSRRN